MTRVRSRLCSLCREYQYYGKGLFFAAVLLTSHAIGLAKQPNVVLFVVDDMGWQDTSVEFHGERTVWNDLYNTPSMERLAAKGMKFTSAYAASPVCSPTRTSLMTGKNPARSKITSWIGHGQPSNSSLNSPQWASTGLQPGDGNTTLPTILKANGYRTAHVGKAHFGGSGTAGADPTNLGFDINVGGSHIGGPFSYFSPWIQRPNIYPNLQQYPAGTYITDALTSEANVIIDQAVVDDVPFFINLAHYAVHAPIGGQGDPNFLPQYQAAGRPNPEDDYAAMVASMDKSLGAVLDNLEAEGIADNTIVLFMSDNGGLSNHTRNFGGTRTVKSLDGDDVEADFRRDKHNTPINSGKGSGYEGGVRVPMIVAWAGQTAGQPAINANLPIAPNSASHEPVISDDFFPTILNMAGVTNIQQYTHDGSGKRIIDGNDLTPVLAGADSFDRDGPLVFHYPHQWYQDVGVGLGIEPVSAIRDGDHKLLYFYGDGQVDGQGPDPRIELYNLTDDIGEENNLADTHPNTKRKLTNVLVQYLIDVDAPIPVVKATGADAQLPEVVDNVIGDMNNDELIQVDDWLAFRAILNSEITAATLIEAEDQGDLNFDLKVDKYDFLLFKAAFDEANGPGALDAAVANVPEPSTLVCAVVCVATAGLWDMGRLFDKFLRIVPTP